MHDAFGRGALLAAKPSVWAREVLHFEADPKQAELIDSDALDLLVTWSRQTGKTESCAAKIAHFGIHNPGTLTLITSATWRQGSIVTGRVQQDLRIATGELTAWHRGQEVEVEEEDIFGNVKLVRVAALSMSLSNGSQIIAVPPSADSARGYSPHLVVIDESARTRDSLFHAVSPMRAARRVQMIAMTTAGAEMGWYYNLWKNDPDVVKSEYLAADCPRISAEFLAKEQRRLPEMIYRAEYENRWYARSGRLFSDEMIANMMISDGVEPLRAWYPQPIIEGESWMNTGGQDAM